MNNLPTHLDELPVSIRSELDIGSMALLSGSIIIQGRGTEVSLYLIERETAEYWVERDEGDLSKHVHWNGLTSTGSVDLDWADSQFPILNIEQKPLFRHTKGIRFEYGFKVLWLSPAMSEVVDITGNVVDVNGSVIQKGTRSPKTNCTVLEFGHDEVPSEGILTVQTKEAGYLEFICPLNKEFDPGMVELMVAHQGDWPIVYGVKYDGVILDVFADELKPYDIPSSAVCTFI